MKTALVVIATGERYHPYIQPLLLSARTYFVPHTPVLFSDTNIPGVSTFVKIENEGFPGATLHRYHTMLKADRYLQCFDQIFYCDVDMLFVAPIGEEIFSDGITATLHPGYVGEIGTPERNPDSAAAIPFDAMNQYFCGGFQGGDAEAYLKMAETLAHNITLDHERELIAVWHDESHFNRYLYDKPPAKILTPDYCYPEDAGAHYKDKWTRAGLTVTPKLLALTKDKS